jgi:hypothetical protein
MGGLTGLRLVLYDVCMEAGQHTAYDVWVMMGTGC